MLSPCRIGTFFLTLKSLPFGSGILPMLSMLPVVMFNMYTVGEPLPYTIISVSDTWIHAILHKSIPRVYFSSHYKFSRSKLKTWLLPRPPITTIELLNEQTAGYCFEKGIAGKESFFPFAMFKRSQASGDIKYKCDSVAINQRATRPKLDFSYSENCLFLNKIPVWQISYPTRYAPSMYTSPEIRVTAL